MGRNLDDVNRITRACRPTALLLAFLLQIPVVFAQITPTDQISGRDAIPLKVSPAIKTYQATPAAAKRKTTYAKAWTDPVKQVAYGGKNTLTFKMVRNPSTANGATHFRKSAHTTKKGPCPGHADWVCSTQDVQLTATSTSFMNNDYSNANSHIYPGAIFTFNDFYGGQYKEQAGKRNPMSLYTDNPNIRGSSGVAINDPNIISCHDAIATIYRRFTGPAANEATSFDALQSSNSADLNMQISGGASAYGLSFSDAFSSSNSSTSISVTIDARKSVYSISALPPDNGYFADANVEHTPNLMVVSNVSYGVRVLANLTITFTSSSEANDFKAAYSGCGFSANVAFDYLNKHSSTSSAIHGYVVGGAGNTGIMTFDPKTLLRGINDVLNGVTYDNARPIGYQFQDMAGDIIGAESATDKFTTVTCAPATTNPRVTDIRVEFLSGQDGKDYDTNLNIYLYPPNFINPPNQDAIFGAIYGYQSQGHSSAFGGGQTSEVFMIPGNGVGGGQVLTRNDFIKFNGGHIRMNIYPNGNDTWDITTMRLFFNFEDGSSIEVDKSNFVVSQTVRVFDWNFNASAFGP